MALSMKIEMRVLPFCTTTAPRLPFEKSYSGFIAFPLLARRAARRDQAAGVLALGPADRLARLRAPAFRSIFALDRFAAASFGRGVVALARRRSVTISRRASR